MGWPQHTSGPKLNRKRRRRGKRKGESKKGTPVHLDAPQPGFYKTRLARDGPFVPVLVHLPRAEDPHTGEATDWDYRRVSGGLLVQSRDVGDDPTSEWKVVTKREPTDAERADLEFAWKLVRHVKSNAIVFAQGRQLVGVGAGQMSRVDSVGIAARKAGERSRGAVMASDAFFPFRDGIDEAVGAGITAVIEPGGSRRDDEVVAAANQHNMAMIFTGRRHFRH